jgi:hypothetical protein
MDTPDFTVQAAEIASDLIARSDEILGLQDYDALRTVLRIGFDVGALLASDANDDRAREWAQDTVCAGCEFALLSRNVWQLLGQFDELPTPGPGPDTFPEDLHDLARQLDAVLKKVQDQAAPLSARLRAVNRIARLQLIFLGATLW